MLFGIDATLLDTYGNQKGEGFNSHYRAMATTRCCVTMG